MDDALDPAPVALETIQLIRPGTGKGQGMQIHRHGFCFSSGLVILGTLLGACSNAEPFFECAQEEQTSAESPDGRFKASVVLVQCGATTSDATWVLLSPTGRKPDPDRDTVAVFEGKAVRATWVAGALDIAHGDLRSFKSESSLHGVPARYTKIDPTK